MKKIQLGTVRCGRRPTFADRPVAEILADALYAFSPAGIPGQVGRDRLKVAHKLEAAIDAGKGDIVLEDAEHATLCSAIKGFISSGPDDGLYEAHDRALNAEDYQLPS